MGSRLGIIGLILSSCAATAAPCPTPGNYQLLIGPNEVGTAGPLRFRLDSWEVRLEDWVSISSNVPSMNQKHKFERSISNKGGFIVRDRDYCNGDYELTFSCEIWTNTVTVDCKISVF